MAASAPTSSLFQPWERQGNPWKQRPDQIRCAPGKRKGLVRATIRSDGRGLSRFRTVTCWRRASISVWSAARLRKASRTMVRKVSIVLCMPAKISGGGRKFQGFRGGWNKWEAHRSTDELRENELVKRYYLGA